MAKTQTSSTTPKLETREGLRKNSGDVVGFRDPEKQGSVYGIPRACKANDSKLDSTKPSVFVIFELLEDCKVTEGSADEATEVQARKGDMVGVWVKGGMRALKNMGGLKVLVQYVGEKKLKDRPAAQSAMKVYQFDTDKAVGTPIPVIEDNRKDSQDVVNYWLPAAKGALVNGSKKQDSESEDFSDAF